MKNDKVMSAPPPNYKRVLALLIDIVIIYIFIIGPFTMVTGGLTDLSFDESMDIIENNEAVYNTLMTSMIFIGTLIFIYFVSFEWWVGQTPGKMMLKLKVVADNNNKVFGTGKFIEPTIWQCIARSFVSFPFFPFIILWIIDPIFMVATKKKQRLSELISKTRTIERHLL